MKDLKERVCKANKDLELHKLVVFTWGNVSGIDRDKGLVVIKPSGISYKLLKPEDMVVVDMEGNIVEGKLRPSSDTESHLELYRNFVNIGSVVHTHSEWATSWAQAGRSIPAFGTTHADYFRGDIPCTRFQYETEVEGKYELETGRLIINEFRDKNHDQIPGVLVAGHGPFTWGKDPDSAVKNSVVLEYLAKLSYQTIQLGRNKPIEKFLLDKHFLRKHGENAYYGQD